jgi:hypothetical protein
VGTVLLGGATPPIHGFEQTVRPVAKVCAAGPAAVQAKPARVPGEWRDAGAGVTFSAAQPGPSRLILRARATDFSFEKSVVPSGATEMQIVAGGDRVTLSLDATSVRVTRGETTLTLDPRASNDEDIVKLHRLLAGSKAVRAARALAAHYESLPAGEDGAYAISMLIDGAVIGFLSGDPGAIPRIARRLAVRRATGLQRAAFRGQDRFPDCWGDYENTVYWAAGEYTECLHDASDDPWLIRGINMDYCGVVWVMRAESAWFQFAKCAALPKA